MRSLGKFISQRRPSKNATATGPLPLRICNIRRGMAALNSKAMRSLGPLPQMGLKAVRNGIS